MSNLCTVEDVKNYLGIRSNDDDNLITSLIISCSRTIESYISRKFEVQEYTDVFSGKDRVMYAFKQHPVISITSITVNNRLVHYKALSDNELVLNDGCYFSSGNLNCKVVYQAGFKDIPEDIQMACYEFVGYHYKLASNINISSSTIKDNVHSYFSPRDIPEYIKVTLKQYKRVI